MLLCGYTCQWLEPVAVMGCPFLDSPLLHLMCYHISHFHRQLFAFFYGLFQFLINLLGQSLLHNGIIKYITSKNIRHFHKIFH